MSDPLDCDRALEQLQDYLKQEATPERARVVAEHLERCAPCLCHARFERNFLALLGTTAADIRCPDTLRQRVAELLRREAEAGPP